VSSIEFQSPTSLRGLTELNLLDRGISTIVWATGYGLDYRWINAPILDDLAYERNVRGVSNIPGLYFLGLLWQHSQASASLIGPEFDGPALVDSMALTAGQPYENLAGALSLCDSRCSPSGFSSPAVSSAPTVAPQYRISLAGGPVGTGYFGEPNANAVTHSCVVRLTA
jgi:hypothetical protein